MAAGDGAADWADHDPEGATRHDRATRVPRGSNTVLKVCTLRRTVHDGVQSTPEQEPDDEPHAATKPTPSNQPATERYVAARRVDEHVGPSGGRSATPAYLAWSSETRSQLPPRNNAPASTGTPSSKDRVAAQRPTMTSSTASRKVAKGSRGRTGDHRG